MTGDIEGGSPPRGPIYAIELREHVDGAEVAIVRLPGNPAAAGRSDDVWTTRFADVSAARTVMHVMTGRPDRWAVWARMADILGKDFLTGLIKAEVVEAAMMAFKEALARTTNRSAS
jgi:hypothetical protein